jgi:hypothetical protein
MTGSRSDRSALLTGHLTGFRKRFLGELEFYIRSAEREQDTRLHTGMPTFDEYLNTRMGSGAVRVLLRLIECVSVGGHFWRRLTTDRYDLDYQTPDEVVEDADLERLWLYANLNTCL